MTSIGRRWRRKAVPLAVPRPVRPFGVRGVPAEYGWLVEVCGEVDIATSPHLREALAQRPPAGALLLVDLTDVTFIDSSGLSVLLTLHRDVKAAGERLAVVCPDGPARLLFEVTGVEAELPLFPTREAALA